MPSAIRAEPQPNETAQDDLDNLFDYDDAVEEFLKDLPLSKTTSTTNPLAPASPKKDIDEEITIRKKRKPIPKLDATLLTSEKGIPALRKITKSRLKFRGKGHEFSDMANLLSVYQLWLDDLYPRAKFRDALGMVEKLGHGKRLQVMRRAWLDETKPMAGGEDGMEGLGDVEMSGRLPVEVGKEGERGLFSDDDEDDGDVFPSDAGARKGTEDANVVRGDGEPDEDELDTLLAGQNTPQREQAEVKKPKGPFEEDEDDEDELDALLAEQPTTQAAKATTTTDDDAQYADDEEAMAEMDTW